MKKIVVLVAGLLSLQGAYAQDAEFINPTQSLLKMNPSFAGSNGSIRNQFAYLNQWPSLAGSYITMYNGLDAYVKPLHGGLALTAVHSDQAGGTLKSSEIDLTYAAHFECKESGIKVIPSIQIGYLQNKMDAYKLGGPSYDPPAVIKRNMDLSAGLLLNYKELYLGASVFHINQPDVGLLGTSKLPARLNINASYNHALNESTLINITGVYSRQQKYNSARLGVNAIFFKHVMAGLGATFSDALYGNIGYRNTYLSATLGHAITFSKLADNTAGAWQLALGFRLPAKTQSEQLAGFEKW